MGVAHTRKVFNIFDAWAVFADDDKCHGNKRDEARGAIYRGQEVFNNNQFVISGVNGFNNVAGIGEPYVGTCSSCHNVPERRRPRGHPHDGHRDGGRGQLQSRAADHHRAEQDDDGDAPGLRPGPWSGQRPVDRDRRSFRVPPLRGLAARAPYFHNGSAKNIKQALRYHEDRFNINLSHGKRKDLEAFLGAL